MAIFAVPSWAKKLVPRTEGETDEQYRERWQAFDEQRKKEKTQAEAEKNDALQKQSGLYRILVSGPGSAFQIFATNADNAEEFLKRRLPAILEQEFGAQVVPDDASKVHQRSRSLIVLEVSDAVTNFRRGDRFESVSELGRALLVANAASLIYQQRNTGKNQFTIRGVTFCFLENYNPETGQVES